MRPGRTLFVRATVRWDNTGSIPSHPEARSKCGTYFLFFSFLLCSVFHFYIPVPRFFSLSFPRSFISFSSAFISFLPFFLFSSLPPSLYFSFPSFFPLPHHFSCVALRTHISIFHPCPDRGRFSRRLNTPSDCYCSGNLRLS